MIESSAKDLIDKIFSNEFNRDDFLNFSNKLLYSASFQPIIIDGDDIPKIFQEHVQSLECLATYTDANNKEIDLLIVTLLKDTALDRARTMQRNFIAQYLDTVSKNAALVAFVSSDVSHWRFSLIKIEARIVGIDIETTITPAKRWSFLVGKNEGCHTVKSQLIPILLDNTRAPSLNELEQAFDIETVSKEFFEKYSDLFFRMKESLDELVENDQDLKNDFTDKGIDTADFAKKTMGQISFLYFLQKKGWFGVAPGKEWGSGVKNFLREVFNRRDQYGNNFFDDVLEPMFYEALAQDRGNESIYPRLNNIRMPFLNGGLFEPMNNYSWETTKILLPDELFSNKFSTNEGDIGDGILDIFDRYNFTVNESDPLDQEIAVDPEMLGKVFENLLDKKERGDKGAFYTPREIVQFMCQESLIDYLDVKTNSLISKEDLKTFIKHSAEIYQNDLSILNDSTKKRFLLPQHCIDNAKELDALLQDILVCDPAVGSGAFPIGMLNEIVDARKVLELHLNNQISSYDLKLHTISKSLYGVDLDPGAVEIAKLRFWLSLVVEEDKPIPLPNLEHKIMQGNSLISQYEGIELFNGTFLEETEILADKKTEINEEIQNIQSKMFALQKSGELDPVSKSKLDIELIKLNKKKNKLDKKYGHISETRDLFDDQEVFKLAQEKIKLLQSKIARFISLDSKTVKENLKQEIDNLKWDLIELTLQEKGETASLVNIKQQRKDRVKPFFIWKLEFSEVFSKKNGFDIVIGNPPYLRVQGIEEDISKTYKTLYESATGSYDLYVLFAEKGMKLLSDSGVLNYIMPHKWVNSSYGKGLRTLTSNNIRKFISFEAYRVFNASTYTSLIWFDKSKTRELNYIGLEKDLTTNHELRYFLNSLSHEDFTTIENKTLSSDAWVLTNKQIKQILDKLNNQTLKVSDVFKNIFQGIATGRDSVYFLTNTVEKGDFIQGYSKELEREVLIEKQVIKPLLKGNSVHRYEKIYTNEAVIFPYNILSADNSDKAELLSENEIKNKFPNCYKYFKDCEDILRSREKGKFNLDDGWFQFARKQGIIGGNKEKLITPYLSMGSQLSYDKEGKFYSNTKCFGLIKNPNFKESYKFYLSILNSKLTWFFIKNTSSVMSGGFYTYTKEYLNPFPLPKISNQDDVKPFEELVDRITANKNLNIDTNDLEEELDNLVYKLYELTDEEIEFVKTTSNL
tara:strand:+ start:4253 stop:7849 length:3597 start_codon:yes stop_codon:yes gene_type:complete